MALDISVMKLLSIRDVMPLGFAYNFCLNKLKIPGGCNLEIVTNGLRKI